MPRSIWNGTITFAPPDLMAALEQTLEELEQRPNR
jgi:hypothetical protein